MINNDINIINSFQHINTINIYYIFYESKEIRESTSQITLCTVDLLLNEETMGEHKNRSAWMCALVSRGLKVNIVKT